MKNAIAGFIFASLACFGIANAAPNTTAVPMAMITTPCLNNQPVVGTGAGLPPACGVASGTGTVTSFAFPGGNGFVGTVTNSTTTPSLAIGISPTGILKGASGSIAAATAGTDYQVPISLTTTGSSGNSTFNATTGVLNIPNYTPSSFGAGSAVTGITSGNILLVTSGFLSQISPSTFASVGSANSFSGQQTFQTVHLSTNVPSSTWGWDTTGATTTLSAGGSITLPVGSGLIVIGENTVSGQMGLFLTGSGASTLVSQTGTIFSNAVTTNLISLSYNGSSYVLTNSRGVSVNVTLSMIRTRTGN